MTKPSLATHVCTNMTTGTRNKCPTTPQSLQKLGFFLSFFLQVFRSLCFFFRFPVNTCITRIFLESAVVDTFVYYHLFCSESLLSVTPNVSNL